MIVRKALSAVARINGRFGIQAAVKLLRGAADERLTRARLDQSRTYGCLAERSEDWLLSLLRRCVAAGWVDFRGGDRPVVVLTEEGALVMRGKHPVRLLLPPSHLPPLPSTRPRRAAGAGRRASAKSELGELGPEAQLLFEALRRRRLELARARGVPPYVIASDRTLRDIAQLRPRTLEELQLAHGIGPARADSYGAQLLEVVRAASV